MSQERQAREVLRKLEQRLAANLEMGEPEAKGPLIAARYAERWIESRRGLVEDAITIRQRPSWGGS